MIKFGHFVLILALANLFKCNGYSVDYADYEDLYEDDDTEISAKPAADSTADFNPDYYQADDDDGGVAVSWTRPPPPPSPSATGDESRQVQEEEDDSNDYYDADYLDEVSVYEGLAKSEAVELLPRDTAELLAPELDISRESAESLSRFANAHPYAVAKFTLDQLKVVLHRSKVIHMLKNETLHYLTHSQEFVDHLSRLPKTTIAAMISSNPSIVEKLCRRDEDFAAKKLTKKLLKNASFLRRIPAEIHAHLAETDFRLCLTPPDVLRILQVHPELPNQLGARGRALVPELIVATPTFVSRKLPCQAIVSVATNAKIVDSLGSEEIGVLARNQRVWDCLPVEVIRHLAKHSRIGGKIGFGEVFAAASRMSKHQSLDPKVLKNLFRHQLKEFTKYNFLPSFLRT